MGLFTTSDLRMMHPEARQSDAYDALSRMTEWRQVGSGAPKVEKHIYRGAEWQRAATIVRDGSGASQAIAYLYDGDNVCADLSDHGGALAVEAFYVTPFLVQNLLLIKDGGRIGIARMDWGQFAL